MDLKLDRKKVVVGAAMLLSFVFGFLVAMVRTAPSSAYGNSTPVLLGNQTGGSSASADGWDGGNGGDSTAHATSSRSSTPDGAAAVPVTAATDPSCIVKAKRKTTGTSLYYVAGDISYKRVKQTDCFDTEAEAQAAGFTKAGG